MFSSGPGGALSQEASHTVLVVRERLRAEERALRKTNERANTNALWARLETDDISDNDTTVLIDSLAEHILELRDQFSVVSKCQIHQWLLSCELSLTSGASLPKGVTRVKQEMDEACLQAFSGQATRDSRLQRDMAAALLPVRDLSLCRSSRHPHFRSTCRSCSDTASVRVHTFRPKCIHSWWLSMKRASFIVFDTTAMHAPGGGYGASLQAGRAPLVQELPRS